MKKLLWVGASVAIVLAVCTGAVVAFGPKAAMPEPVPVNSTPTTTEETVSENKQPPDACAAAGIAAGRYTEYRENSVAECGYNTTILFFHAPWCPECRGFEKAIESGEIPSGTQVLKVDYDSSSELRKKYGVTIQSTFVRVDAAGEKQTVWNGYGKDKSITAILENTQ